ncbi:MAG: hypothetical protein NZM33_14185, partial [Bryobacteraceae bacterium]|nr:hypothetical protein [Bryobacteraceae bacterium]
ILRTRDGGKTWSRQNSPVAGLLRAICFTSSGAGLIAGDEILISRDGGETWQPAPLRSSETFTGVVAEDGRMWAVSPHGVFASLDGGETWLARHPLLPAAAGS